ncbi:TRAP transporter permease [Sulfitobacter dubius]|uniref:Sialic acid TRAP transporter large permease protein SiaM n=1 Tax=Sulfitobacter dubius TaxID=218673 RepID=A0ABY3ZRG3_9RHOB|nr:TRAP transporter fused permease subunit [Sulfitobacter dubius]UOA17200.1 Sialic acid TRAP transporter large permease protein SiaM [Sulfitobacter dubius]
MEDRVHSTKQGPFSIVTAIILIGYALFEILTSFFGMLEPLIQRSLFLGLGLGSVFLVGFVESGQNGWRRWYLLPLAAIGFYVGFHITWHNERISNFMIDITATDKVLGLLAIALVLDAARRSIGIFLPALAILGLAYYYFGNAWISGPWQPPRVSLITMIETYYASTETIFGYMIDLGTRVIAIFIILGALMLSTGATDIFVKLATRIAGRSYGGQAKICTASSALFGTVTGSAVANVMAMGQVTIPTMRRAGYSGGYAAAVEAVASAGGQIMPPIMGAGAFIMAEILGIPYSQVVVAAIFPAFFFFMTVWLSVGFYARRRNIAPLTKEELPAWSEIFDPYTSLPLYLPLGAMIALLSMNYTPTFAGAIAVGLLLVSQLALRIIKVFSEGQPKELGQSLMELLRQVLTGLYNGGRAVAMIAVLLACAAIVVKVLLTTGIGVKVAGIILSVSMGSLIAVLVLTAILAILLGMDVPTTASYILASAVAAPILVGLGIVDLHAHLFIFYFAIMSAITPPVCASVFAAASIANVNFWRVASHAVIMAVGLYLIPFMFIFRPGVLMEGTTFDIATDVVITGIAILAITAASSGFLTRTLNPVMRVALYIGAALLFVTTGWSDVVGFSIIGAVAVWGHFTRSPPAPLNVANAGKQVFRDNS